MNWTKIRKLIHDMNLNLSCRLHEGDPCATCESGIVKSIEDLNEEVEQ